MQTIKKALLVCLFYLPLIGTLINGHQFAHHDEGDSPDEVCLVCQQQQEQEDLDFVLPITTALSPLRPVTAFPARHIFTTTENQSVGYLQTIRSRPPPSV